MWAKPGCTPRKNATTPVRLEPPNATPVVRVTHFEVLLKSFEIGDALAFARRGVPEITA